MITKERIAELTKQFGETEKDTGNSRVQVAILSDKIKYLTEHLKTHKKDSHSRRGMRLMLGKRSSLLKHMKVVTLKTEKSHPESKALENYKEFLNTLGLKDRY
ncbi:MAG: 30S ribosomal protein S15 [Candidatus Delongbacteria bacterium]|nr:30S ribosomal protein S15 [Candidatus Delongbacteria bacterium]MBN2836491.1 30S ribosomal protein S15 [Candidatus Delongbacteria bacterium]